MLLLFHIDLQYVFVEDFFVCEKLELILQYSFSTPDCYKKKKRGFDQLILLIQLLSFDSKKNLRSVKDTFSKILINLFLVKI